MPVEVSLQGEEFRRSIYIQVRKPSAGNAARLRCTGHGGQLRTPAKLYRGDPIPDADEQRVRPRSGFPFMRPGSNPEAGPDPRARWSSGGNWPTAGPPPGRIPGRPHVSRQAIRSRFAETAGPTRRWFTKRQRGKSGIRKLWPACARCRSAPMNSPTSTEQLLRLPG